MTANFQSYAVPFDPRVPPVYPASTINDEFRAQNPSLTDPFDPTLVYVVLDPKWSQYAPGGIFASVIDPTRQMALITGSVEKAWCGIMQDLPLPPVADDEPISYTIIARMLNAFIQSGENDDTGPLSYGLLFGENMRSAPTTTPLWTLCSQLTRSSGGIGAATITAAQADFSAPILPDGVSNYGPPNVWFSARVMSAQTAPGVFDTDLVFSVSENGESWQKIWYYTLGNVALRQFALAQRSLNGVGMGTWADFVRYYPYQSGDDKPIVGQLLQLGSV